MFAVSPRRSMISSHSYCLFAFLSLSLTPKLYFPLLGSRFIWTFSHRLTFLRLARERALRRVSILIQQISTISSCVGIEAINWNTWQLAGVGRGSWRMRCDISERRLSFGSSWAPTDSPHDSILLSSLLNLCSSSLSRLCVRRRGEEGAAASISRMIRLQIPPRPRPSVVAHWYSTNAFRVEMKIKWNFIDFLALRSNAVFDVSLLFFSSSTATGDKWNWSRGSLVCL